LSIQDVKEIPTFKKELIHMDENKAPITEDSTSDTDAVETKYTQSDFDKLFSQARKKWEKEAKEQITKAEQLGKMDAEQRKQADLEEALKKIAEYEKREAINTNMKEASKIMAARNVPLELADLLVTEDNEKTLENIKVVERAIKNQVAALAKDLQKGNTPQAGSTVSGKVTKEQFSKLNIADKEKVRISNPELFKEFTGK
jgi:hypothetical protein